MFVTLVDWLLPILLFLTSTFLILLVLVQRGRGGGLAGAFGGMGGQSAFGTKAGDMFTKITIGVAAFWIVLCAFAVKWFSNANSGMLDSNLGKPFQSAPLDVGKGSAAPVGKSSDDKSGSSGATSESGDTPAAGGSTTPSEPGPTMPAPTGPPADTPPATATPASEGPASSE